MRRTIVRAVLTAVLLAPAALVLGSSPAGAATQTMTVTPSSGIADGQTIDVTISNSTVAHHTIAICDDGFLDAGGDLRAAIGHCTAQAGTYVEGDYSTSTFTVPIVARHELTGLVNPVVCGEEPYDCMVVDWQGTFDASSAVTVPIDVSLVNQLSVAPSTELPTNATVTATGTKFAPGPIQLQTCTRTWAGAPDAATADASCGAVTPATVAADGTVTSAVAVSDPFTTRSGASTACGQAGCSLVASSAAEPLLAARPLAFGTPTLTADQTDGLLDYHTVAVQLHNVAPGRRVVIGLCTTAAAGGQRACNTQSGLYVADASEQITGSIDVRTGVAYANDDTPSDCREVSCSFVAIDADGGRAIAAPLPVTFGPRPVATLTPSSGLLEGQPMALRVTNLAADAYLVVRRCANAETCTQGETVGAPSSGVVESTVVASERLGGATLCHGGCTVRLQDGGFSEQDVYVGYTTAEGSVTATPSTGLTSGQNVVIAGTDLMSTYAGRSVFFPTGGWAVGICEKAVGDHPTLVDLFLHCAVAPGGAHVDVPGSTSSTTVQAPATFTKILGGTVDCRTVSGGCVIGLNRWEQDGTLTSHFTPIAFAG